MKNSQNLVSYSPVKGVYLDFADSMMTDIVDIDVESGIRSIVLSGPNAERNRLSRRIKLRNIFKQFPDVEELVIKEDIVDIDISNFMFPSVRNVNSENPYFFNCQYLIWSIGLNSVLKNTFCIKPVSPFPSQYLSYACSASSSASSSSEISQRPISSLFMKFVTNSAFAAASSSDVNSYSFPSRIIFILFFLSTFCIFFSNKFKSPPEYF